MKRVSLIIPKELIKELDEHLKHFAFRRRSVWLTDAIIERMAREKNFLLEKDNDYNEQG